MDQSIGLLVSLPSEIESKELSLFENITFNFIADEYDQAEYLFKNGFSRAAGVVAGVALERHVHLLAEKNNIEVKVNPPTKPKAEFSDYLASLKKADIINEVQRKQLDALYQIRKACAHPEEPKKEDIDRLIGEGKLLASTIR